MEEEATLFFTREAVNHYGAKNLIQLPIKFHNTPRMPEDGKDAEFRALADSGASNSFISTKKAKELGLKIEEITATVKNGDGSKQLSPGWTMVTFSLGAKFKTTHRLRVINLEIFDVIIGFDFFLQYHLQFDYDPFRLARFSSH